MRSGKGERRWTGRAIRALRDRLGLTQEGLAAQIPTSGGEVSRWEHEHHAPSRLAQRRLEELDRAAGREG
jgi:DNA-binding transcriptional regulator YiaG